MNELLQSLLDNSSLPFVSAFLLGLLTAISPCPLATNIAAVGYIVRSSGGGKKSLYSGLLYTAGRMLAYSLLGVVLIVLLRRGASAFHFEQAISVWGERLLGPMLLVFGVLILFGDKLRLPSFGFRGSSRLSGMWGSLLLGILFALAFCPSSALFYFGMLIPLSVSSSMGVFLPVVFSIATALPVLIVAWLLVYSVNRVGAFYNRIQQIQRWINLIVGILFIGVGVYYTIATYIGF